MKRTIICSVVFAALLVACASDDPDAPQQPDPRLPDGECQVGCEPEGRWLHVSALGVAFSSFPSRQVTTRTLDVRSRHRVGEQEVNWTASSDQGWLTATASGVTGGLLTLTANPAGLAPDQQYLATVIVRSSDSAVRNEQRVRVGLWVGSADPQQVALPTFVSHVVGDPVLPLFYANTEQRDVTVYNAYTGALVKTFAGVAGRTETMAISDDGAILFVDDSDNRHTLALDTQTGAELRLYSWQVERSRGLAYARPNAHPILMTTAGGDFDVETGERYVARRSFGIDSSIAVDTRDGHMYTVDHGSSYSDVSRLSLDFHPTNAAPLAIRAIKTSSSSWEGYELCVSADGTRLYPASGFGALRVLSAEALSPVATLSTDLFLQAVACGWNGLVFVGGNGILVYRPDHSVAGFIPDLYTHTRTMALSGDGTRVTSSAAYPSPTFLIHSAPAP